MKSTENPQLMDFLHQNHSFLENCETFDNTMNVDAFTNNKNYKKVNKQNIKKPPSSINCDTVKSNKYLSPEDSCFISQKSNPKNNHSNSSPKANNIPHKNNVPVNKQTSKETPSLNISKLEVPIQQGKVRIEYETTIQVLLNSNSDENFCEFEKSYSELYLLESQ